MAPRRKGRKSNSSKLSLTTRNRINQRRRRLKYKNKKIKKTPKSITERVRKHRQRFKCMNDIGPSPQHYLGEMDRCCQHCGARHLLMEIYHLTIAVAMEVYQNLHSRIFQWNYSHYLLELIYTQITF